MFDFYLFFPVFFISFSVTFLLIRSTSRIDWLIHDLDSHGIQKFHVAPTPSVGGLSVFLAFSFGLWSMSDELDVVVFLWMATLPIFLAGLIEDITLRVTPIQRLFFTFISIIVAYEWVGVSVNSLGFEWVDEVLFNYSFVVLLFTLLVVGGAVNSFNIIDGFNGLLGGYTILATLAIAYVAYTLGDGMILQLSLILAASVFGFFVFNFPSGKIFMGDGGAYFIGLILSIIGLMLVDRHEELSNWFVLLIFIYPMYELLYSIYRRKIVHKTDASQPDVNHLHSLVYRRLISCDQFKYSKVICNSMTSPFLWLLSLFGIVPAIVWFDNQTMLIISAFVFMFIYTIIYKFISQSVMKRSKFQFQNEI
jgi:UDP-N-acetylmuramyl pentapeptide phosphotransferase/UDP-N-acetylglucosamine-1-phosphate transferase